MPEEKRKIDAVLKFKGKIYEDLAKVLGISRPSISTKLLGTRPFLRSEREKVFRFLDKDPQISFLVDEVSSAPDFSVQEKWDSLYVDYTGELRTIYATASPGIKGEILGDLEKAISKYK